MPMGDQHPRLLRSCCTPPIQARQRCRPHRLRLLQLPITKGMVHPQTIGSTRFLCLPKSTRPSIGHPASRKPIQRPTIRSSTTCLPHRRLHPTMMTTQLQNDQRSKPFSMKQRRSDVSTKSEAAKVSPRQWQQWMPEWPCPLFHPRPPSQNLPIFHHKEQEPPFPERQQLAASTYLRKPTPQLHDHNHPVWQLYPKPNVHLSAAPQAHFSPPSTKAEAPSCQTTAITTTSSNKTRIL